MQQLEKRAMLANQVDLALTDMFGPGSVVAGNENKIAISWTVQNQGDISATGKWSDAIYLSADDQLDASDTLLTLDSEEFQAPLAPAATSHDPANVDRAQSGRGKPLLAGRHG